MNRDALMDDLRRAHEISTDLSIFSNGPYKEDNKLERYIWGLAVAMEHYLTEKLKEKN